MTNFDLHSSHKKSNKRSTLNFKKPILFTSAFAIGASPILPLLVPITATVEAKEVADNWLFENANTPEHFKGSNYYLSSASEYTQDKIPTNFNIPSTTSEGYSIRYYGIILQNKNIQRVSFIDANNISVIGGIYSNGTGIIYKTNAFANNRITKIYWNKSSFYNNAITIGESAFKNNLLTSLDLPTKVTNIGHSAFENNKITRITGWKNVQDLGKYAFQNNALTSYGDDGYTFELPKKLDTIDTGTFLNNKLTTVIIPANIRYIQTFAFGGNPITSIEFQNPNTGFPGYELFKTKYDDPYLPTPNLTIFGRGETSSAKNLASYIGASYVNLDPIDLLVQTAEESLTTDSYNAALAAVNDLVESLTKDKYLERLVALQSSEMIGDSVAKAERTLTRADYLAAKTLVNQIESVIIRNKYTQQLNEVLIAIETEEFSKIKTEYDTLISTGKMTVEKLNEIKKALEAFEKIDVSETTNSYTNDRVLAIQNTFKALKDQIVLLEQYPTLQNALKAEKLLSEIEDNYSETETLSDNTVVTTSKADLKTKFDTLVPPIYAKAAVEIADKYLTRDKLDEAYPLVNDLTDTDLKKAYLDKLATLEDKYIEVLNLENEIKKAIEKAEKSLSSDDIEVVSALVEALEKETLKEPYNEQINTLNYKKRVKEIIQDIEKNGVTYDLVYSLTTLIALLPENDPNILEYANQVLKYKNILAEDEVRVSQINEILNTINTFDVNSLTIEKYNELSNLVRILSDDTPEKAGFKKELNELLVQLTALQSDKKAYDLLKEQIDDLDISGNLNNSNLDAIWTAINQLSNTNSVQQLKNYFDESLAKIAKDEIIVNLNDAENQNVEYINNSKTTINSIRDDVLRNATYSDLNSAIEKAISDKIDALSRPDTELFKELKALINTLDDSALQRTLTTDLDNKAETISNDAVNTTNVSNITENFVTTLQDFISNIEDSSTRTTAYNNVDELINEHLTQYFAGASSLTENDIKYLQKFFNTYHNVSHFNNNSDSTVKDLLEDYYVNNYNTIINNSNNDSSNTSTDKELIKKLAEAEKFLSDFGTADFTNTYKEVIEQKLGDLLEEQIKEISKTTALGNNDVNEIIKYVSSFDSSSKQSELIAALEKELSKQVSVTLYDSAKSLEQNGDLTPLLTLLELIKELPNSPVKDTLQEVADNFVESNIELIQDSATSKAQLSKLESLVQDQSIFESPNKPSTNTDDEGSKNTDSSTLSDNAESLETLLTDMKSLKNMLELLTHMQNNNKQATHNISLSDQELQSLIGKLELKNNSTVSSYIGDKELIDKLSDSEDKIDVLTEIIEELNLELSDYKTQLAAIQSSQEEGNTLVEESFISLKSELLSKDKELKSAIIKIGSASLGVLTLLGSFGLASTRNNRRLIQSLRTQNDLLIKDKERDIIPENTDNDIKDK